jgi:uncharacterized protein (DUF488 family)
MKNRSGIRVKRKSALVFTIGYARLSPARLKEISEGLDALVVDVRHVPRSRKAGFSKSHLIELLGARYSPMGHALGGRGNVTPSGIAAVAAYKQDVILMCLEHHPEECHRHHDICAAHFPDAIHIVEDELFTARELSRTIDAGDRELTLVGGLAELIENPEQRHYLFSP